MESDEIEPGVIVDCGPDGQVVGDGRRGCTPLVGRQSPARRGYNRGVVVVNRALDNAVNALVDDYRTQCLWFLRPDYYPATRKERLRVLDYVQRYGDRGAHVRAAALRQWLSQISSADSAAS